MLEDLNGNQHPNQVGQEAYSSLPAFLGPFHKTLVNGHPPFHAHDGYAQNKEGNCPAGNELNHSGHGNTPYPLLNLQFLKRRSTRMVTAVEQKVATTMGPIMSVGEWEPWAALRAIMVVGMTVKLDEVTAIKVHWALEAVSLLGFSSCRWAMAFRPKGVQAFPKPKKLALMLKRTARSEERRVGKECSA